MVKFVRDILKGKGTDVWSIRPDSTVYEALQLMAEKNCGAILVMESDRILGIFSERDYARKVILRGRTSRDTKVSEIMNENVIFVNGERTVEESMALMSGKRIRHLPVLEGDKLIGLISIGDIVKAVIEEKEYIIKELENYITGRNYS